MEFSGGFGDLHDRSYELILDGKGFGLEDSRAAIDAVAAIRTSSPLAVSGDCHPLALRRV